MTDAPSNNVVILCTDAGFLLPTAFIIDQLAEDPSGARYDVVVLHEGLDAAAAGALAERARRPVSTIPFRSGPAGGPEAPQAGHVSRATYIRLHLHQLLPKHYRRIVYLDSDVYIERQEIAALFDVDLGDAAFAAVEDALHRAELLHPEFLPDEPRAWRGPDGMGAYRRGLGLDPNEPYFNSGLMLIDRERWASLEIGERALAFLHARHDRCLFAEQSALNAVAAGRWVDLSPRYNYQPLHAMAGLDAAIRPVVRHFAGPYKPWNTDVWGARLSGEYRNWLAGSGWPGAFPGVPASAPPVARILERRARPSLSARLRRRLFGARPAAVSPGRAALCAAALAAMAGRRFIDLDASGRQALFDAVSAARGG